MKAQVKLSAIIEGIEFAAWGGLDEHHAFLDTRSGEVLLIPEDAFQEADQGGSEESKPEWMHELAGLARAVLDDDSAKRKRYHLPLECYDRSETPHPEACMTDSPYLPFIVLAIVVGAFAAGIAAIIRAAKRQAAERKRTRLDLGFAEAPEAAEPLTERMQTVHMHWSASHQVRDPWRKSDWGYELFLFDLRSGSGKSTKLERDQAMVVSADLAVPRFSLAAKAPGDGFVAQMANKAIAWVASKVATPATFPDQPEFDAKYFVFGDDETALREYFDSRRRGRLLGIEHLQASGSGDAFLFTKTPYKPVKKADQEKLQDLLQDARTLFEIFKS